MPEQVGVDAIGDPGSTGHVADHLADTLAGQHMRRWTGSLLAAGEQRPCSPRADGVNPTVILVANSMFEGCSSLPPPGSTRMGPFRLCLVLPAQALAGKAANSPPVSTVVSPAAIWSVVGINRLLILGLR